jgi:hypothetical protein
VRATHLDRSGWCRSRALAAVAEDKNETGVRLVDVVMGMVVTDPAQRISLDEALNLLGPSSDLQGSFCSVVHDEVCSSSTGVDPLDSSNLGDNILQASLVGREWLWTQIVRTVRVVKRRTLLVLGDSGVTQFCCCFGPNEVVFFRIWKVRDCN